MAGCTYDALPYRGNLLDLLSLWPYSEAIYRYVRRITPRQRVSVGCAAASDMNATQTWHVGDWQKEYPTATKAVKCPAKVNFISCPKCANDGCRTGCMDAKRTSYSSRNENIPCRPSIRLLQLLLMLLMLIPATAAKVAQSLMTCDIES